MADFDASKILAWQSSIWSLTQHVIELPFLVGGQRLHQLVVVGFDQTTGKTKNSLLTHGQFNYMHE